MLLFFDHASGFYSLGIVLGFRVGGAWFIASVGLGCSFGLSLGEWGGWILPLGGLQLLGFRGWSTCGQCLQGHGDSWGFFVSCIFEKKRQNRVTISWVFGVAWVFHSLGACVGWHFCPVYMGMGLHSFLALGWCLDGGDLGWGRGAVATWGFSERSKNIYFFKCILSFFVGFFLIIIFFVDNLGFRQIA